jgi:hypothetical protein
MDHIKAYVTVTKKLCRAKKKKAHDLKVLEVRRKQIQEMKQEILYNGSWDEGLFPATNVC